MRWVFVKNALLLPFSYAGDLAELLIEEIVLKLETWATLLEVSARKAREREQAKTAALVETLSKM